MSQKQFNKHEVIILQTLYRERRPMALHELAGITGISWVTVRKYILILEKKNFVVKRVENKQANWQINYERLT